MKTIEKIFYKYLMVHTNFSFPIVTNNAIEGCILMYIDTKNLQRYSKWAARNQLYTLLSVSTLFYSNRVPLFSKFNSALDE